VQHSIFYSVIQSVMINSGKIIDINSGLISDCRKNNRTAQIELYKLYSKRMYNASLRILKNRMLSEDAVQEAFINAFRTLNNFRAEVPFESWLRRIVINQSIDLLRKEKKILLESVDNVNIVDSNNFDNETEDMLEKEHLVSEVKKQLDYLPDGYRIILSLYYLEGYDHEEIAQILQISQSTSRSQLTRALKRLRERMHLNQNKNEFRHAK
jgi:RNA polymerase sigma factor (sigma-70 family)